MHRERWKSMLFKFNIYLNDNDYLDFNRFWMIRSPYGKKQILIGRILAAVLLGAMTLVSLVDGSFSLEAWRSALPYIILLALFELLLEPFWSWCIKAQLKSLKKSGKMGYSPVSEIEFYDETFVETTPEAKTEQKYSSIERVSIIAGKVIYFHVSNVTAYLLPLSCFESKEQFDRFYAFIKTKCADLRVYE